MLEGWPKNAAEAIALQQRLRGKVRLDETLPPVRLIAGIDCSYDKAANIARSVIVLMDMQTMRPILHAVAHEISPFPYIPGLLSFRELPSVLKALEMLPQTPDLLMVDGQGVAHPRRLGIASHLGVVTGLPAIGVAKSRLTGRFEALPDQTGAEAPLMDGKERIGTVLVSKRGCNPLFVSPGHRIGFEDALHIAKACLSGYRLPEPTRMADKISKQKPQPGVVKWMTQD